VDTVIVDGDKAVILTASLTGFGAGTANVVVTDNDTVTPVGTTPAPVGTTPAPVGTTPAPVATTQPTPTPNPAVFQLQGRVSISASGNGLRGIAINVFGPTGSRSTTTDSDGNYTVSGLTPGSYTVTPAFNGLTFSPPSRTLTVGPSFNGVDFFATLTGGSTVAPPPAPVPGNPPTNPPATNPPPTNPPPTNPPATNPPTTTPPASQLSVSGRITTSSGFGLRSIVVTLVASNGQTATTTTDTNGIYSFAGVASGSYTVTPSFAGLRFSPTSRTANVGTISVGGVNFIAGL